MVIGVISDTHGLLRPEAIEALQGSDVIIHAGDVGKPEILDALAAIAPIHAIRGNIDNDPWARRLPESRIVKVEGLRLFVIHDANQIKAPVNYEAIITGHTHIPKITWKDSVLHLNPGSAGPRRFKLPVSIATIHVADGTLKAGLIKLG